MKKTFRWLGLAMVAVLLGIGATACSDDDDNDKNPADFTEHDSALVGSWVKTETGNGWSDTETITFNSDGTYSETDVEINGTAQNTTWERGTWKTNKLKNRVVFEVNASSDPTEVGDLDEDTYSVNGTVLRLDNDVYTAVAAN